MIITYAKTTIKRNQYIRNLSIGSIIEVEVFVQYVKTVRYVWANRDGDIFIDVYWKK
jgi:hypothetical protein